MLECMFLCVGMWLLYPSDSSLVISATKTTVLTPFPCYCETLFCYGAKKAMDEKYYAW